MNPKNRALLSLAVMVLLVASGGFIAYQLNTDLSTENASASGKCCDGGTCDDRRTFGSDTNGIPHNSCGERAADFCKGGYTGGDEISCTASAPAPSAPAPSSGGNNNTCDNDPVTAKYCRDKTVGYNPGGCVCTRTEGTRCACVAPTEPVRTGVCIIGNSACTGKSPGTKIGISGGQCECTSLSIIDGTNSNCSCVTISSSTSGGSTSGGSTGGTTSGNTAGAGAACTPGSTTCPQGYQCTPTDATGTRNVCNPLESGAQCPAGDSCNRILAFKCNSNSDFEADGSCYQGRSTVSSFQAGLDYINGCGQVDTVCGTVDQLCGSFTIKHDSCGGATTVTASTPPPTTIEPPVVNIAPVCGDSCSTTAECPNAHTCEAGTCTLNTCLSPNACGPDSACGSPISCGETCGPGGTCPNSHTCNVDNACVLDFCLADPGNCTDNACTPATCGNGVADTAEQCGDGTLSCSNGSTCNDATCQCTFNECGDTCSSNNDCPNDHTCDSGTCKLNFCLDNPDSCAGDSCTAGPIGYLPSTDLDTQNILNIVFGFLLLLISVNIYKLGMVNNAAVKLLAKLRPEITANTKEIKATSKENFEKKLSERKS